MPMHISPTIDTDPGRIGYMFPRLSPIAKSLSPATQTDIHEILQREQDRAMELLSSSPLLASLFVSYANRAAVLESDTPSTESEEWKALENTITRLQQEVDKLTPDNADMSGKLEAAAASQEAFRSQISALKEVNTTQQNNIMMLQGELLNSKSEYGRLLVDSNADRAALQARISDLETQRNELKEAVVEQQVKISKLERQVSGGISGPPDTPRFGTYVGRIPTRRITAFDDDDSVISTPAPTRQPCARPTPTPVTPVLRGASPFDDRPASPVVSPILAPVVANRELGHITTQIAQALPSAPAEPLPEPPRLWAGKKKGVKRNVRPGAPPPNPPAPMTVGDEPIPSSSLTSIPSSNREQDQQIPSSFGLNGENELQPVLSGQQHEGPGRSVPPQSQPNRNNQSTAG